MTKATTLEIQEAIRSDHFIAHTLHGYDTGEMIYLAKSTLKGKAVSLRNVTWDKGFDTDGNMIIREVSSAGAEHRVYRVRDNARAFFKLHGRTAKGDRVAAYIYHDSEVAIIDR